MDSRRRFMLSRRRFMLEHDRCARLAGMVATCLVLLAQTGCWEQVSEEWFPQMKWQPAIQAYELNQYDHQIQLANLMPPDGVVPVGWGAVPDLESMSLQEQDPVPNPNKATFESLARGKEYFDVNCATCHGPTGGGDGPIAAPKGPIQGVLPIGPGSPLGFSLAPGLSDGHIYTTISLGRGRMPSYRRIPPEARWDVVNYIRDLNGQGG